MENIFTSCFFPVRIYMSYTPRKENDWNLTLGCRRFPYLVLSPVLDSIYLYTFSLYENASFIIVSAETEYISTRSCFYLHSIERFPAIYFSIAEVNIRFIHMQPYLGSISNVFHHIKYNAFNKHIHLAIVRDHQIWNGNGKINCGKTLDGM
jgi:hypothetical protein